MKKIIIFSSFLLFSSITSAQGKILYSCGGTEPFWDAWVTDSEVLFTLMGQDSVVFRYSDKLKAEGLQSDYIMIFKLENDKVKPVYLIIKKTEKCKCTDGMSDNEYEYESYFIKDKITYFGCAIKGK